MILMAETDSLLERRGQGGKLATLEEEAAQICDLAEHVVVVHGTFQVRFAGAATGAHTQADHAVYHVHVARTPGGHSVVDLQQCLQETECLLENGLIAVEHDEQGAAACSRR